MSLADIIVPPPDVRAIIHKTAEFVAKSGPSFESKIRDSQSGSVKFAFIDGDDPYNAYYKEKIERLQNGDDSDLAEAISRAYSCFSGFLRVVHLLLPQVRRRRPRQPLPRRMTAPLPLLRLQTPQQKQQSHVQL